MAKIVLVLLSLCVLVYGQFGHRRVRRYGQYGFNQNYQQNYYPQNTRRPDTISAVIIEEEPQNYGGEQNRQPNYGRGYYNQNQNSYNVFNPEVYRNYDTWQGNYNSGRPKNNQDKDIIFVIETDDKNIFNTERPSYNNNYDKPKNNYNYNPIVFPTQRPNKNIQDSNNYNTGSFFPDVHITLPNFSFGFDKPQTNVNNGNHKPYIPKDENNNNDFSFNKPVPDNNNGGFPVQPPNEFTSEQPVNIDFNSNKPLPNGNIDGIPINTSNEHTSDNTQHGDLFFNKPTPTDNTNGFTVQPPNELTSEIPEDNENIFNKPIPGDNNAGFPTQPPKGHTYFTEKPNFSTQTPNPVPNEYEETTKNSYKPLSPVINTEQPSKEGREDKQIDNGDESYDEVNFDIRYLDNVDANKTSTLPPLTPVPTSFDSRNDFNFANFQDTCQTVDGESGSCIPIASCQPYVNILRLARSNPAAVQTLKKAHCGFEGNNPKVCCPPNPIPTVPPPTRQEIIEPTTASSTTPAVTPAPSTEEPVDFDNDDMFLEPPICGNVTGSLGRVVGGEPAKLGAFPWMTLLGYRPRQDGESARWLCGGSLISTRHVLTAAHCIHNRADLYLVRLGELDLDRDDEGATPIDIPIAKRIKHEEYNPRSYTNDIGLLMMERAVEFTPLIRPICIPKKRAMRSMTFEKYMPFIAGWGDLHFHGPTSNILRTVQLPVQTSTACKAAYSEYKDQISIDERVLCAGYPNGGKDACQGDSGGPLMQPLVGSTAFQYSMYQIGVVSFGKKCALPNFPGVYTRVTHYIPWLRKTMVDNQL